MPAWIQMIVDAIEGASWVSSLEKPAWTNIILRIAAGKSWESEVRTAFGL